MKIKLLHVLSAALVGGSVLAGCGSGEVEVDKAAMDARNGQRAAAGAGGAPATATAGSSTAGK